MEKFPEDITGDTIKRARKAAKNAEDIGVDIGTVRWIDGKDLLFFILSNGPDLCLLYCSPDSYLVELSQEDEYGALHESLLMLKNVRNWLFWLRRHNFTDCEHMLEIADEFEDDDYDISFE